jgi:GxxExxY protein
VSDSDFDRQGRQGRQEPTANVDALAKIVVDAALQVHRFLGPGLLESVYEQCLAHELVMRGIAARRQVVLPVSYGGVTLDAGYRLDLVVGESIVIEVKAVDQLLRLHEAQVLTYLKLSGLPLAFLINFNVELLKDGVRRLVLSR